MASVSLQGVAKHFSPGQPVLAGVDLHIADGEFVVFVGPSGSGKSTLLRLIAGLEEASGGEIFIGDKRATELPPAQRGVAMVFQSYALYPHMSVHDNLAFAPRMAGMAKAEVAQRVSRAAQLLQIEPLLQRKPAALSGGQRQRVAIGRAIVREPRVFLFDEPLSNLDAALRQTLRVELAALHRQLGATMVYVTHDQVEAMTLADRMAVFDAGVVQQVGTPAELYRAPCNLFVAGFLGSPRINLLPGRLLRAGAELAEVEVPGLARLRVAADARRLSVGDAVTVGVRPEHLGLVDALADSANCIPAQVALAEYLGDHQLLHVVVGSDGTRLVLKRPPLDVPPAGSGVMLQMAAGQGLLFDVTGRALPRTSDDGAP
jgi:multiple sugar transport system ATP-binding protein